MTDAVHTPGPWQIVLYGDGDSLVICAPNADWRICFMATPGESPNAMSIIRANARRIVACVNALEGISTADIEAGVVKELVEALKTKRDYISDAANGALTYEDSGDGFKAMAAEDLARIDALLAKIGGAS